MKPLHVQRSPWLLMNGPKMPGAMAANWFRRNVSDGRLTVCVAIEPQIGWHLSISFTDHRPNVISRYPTWDEITHARYLLLPDELDFVMHLPPTDEYVSVHATTFHLHQWPEP